MSIYFVLLPEFSVKHGDICKNSHCFVVLILNVPRNWTFLNLNP